MIWFFVVGLVSYLIGSVPSGYIAGRLAGVDIRTLGSGNIGATNVTRMLGKPYGYPVFAADFCKGLIAVCVANRLAHQPTAVASADIYEIVAAVCCVLGNAFPVWLGFRGGKGVAVSAGLLVALMPWAALIAFVLWIGLFLSTRYVSLASIVSVLVLPLIVLGLLRFGKMSEWSFLYVSIALTAFIIWRHRSNISRLFSGTEQRFEKRGD